jgi:hypothetical protein
MQAAVAREDHHLEGVSEAPSAVASFEKLTATSEAFV